MSHLDSTHAGWEVYWLYPSGFDGPDGSDRSDGSDGSDGPPCCLSVVVFLQLSCIYVNTFLWDQVSVSVFRTRRAC